jgi:DNA-binding CsgD family transcriptional regulator
MERVGQEEAAASQEADGGSLGEGLALLMDEWAHGVLVATPEGRLVHANAAARRELARAQALEMRHHHLHATDTASCVKLQDALTRAAAGKRSLVALRSAQGATLTLAVLPLKSGGRATQIALVFSRASVCESLMLCFFARSHGLTPAEEQVLGILCQGCSAPEAAVQLRVAVSTVRSHVRSLCAKTGAAGVRDLVSRVAVLPPVAPFWQEPVH